MGGMYTLKLPIEASPLACTIKYYGAPSHELLEPPLPYEEEKWFGINIVHHSLWFPQLGWCSANTKEHTYSYVPITSQSCFNSYLNTQCLGVGLLL